MHTNQKNLKNDNELTCYFGYRTWKDKDTSYISLVQLCRQL